MGVTPRYDIDPGQSGALAIFDTPNERPFIHGQATHRLLLAMRRIDLPNERVS